MKQKILVVLILLLGLTVALANPFKSYHRAAPRDMTPIALIPTPERTEPERSPETGAGEAPEADPEGSMPQEGPPAEEAPIILLQSFPGEFLSADEPLTYTLLVGNPFPDATLSSIVITDTMSAMLTDVNWQSENLEGVEARDEQERPYVWTIPDIAPGEGGIIVVTGKLSPDVQDDLPRTITSTVVLSADPVAPSFDGSTSSTFPVTLVEPITRLRIVDSGPTPLGNSTSLTARTREGSNATYTWDFGDGTTGSGQMVRHTYTDIGIYTARVTAQNAAGTETASTSISIVSPLALSTMSVEPEQARAGDPLSYTLEMVNRSWQHQMPFTVENRMPAGATYNRGSLAAEIGDASYDEETESIIWTASLDKNTYISGDTDGNGEVEDVDFAWEAMPSDATTTEINSDDGVYGPYDLPPDFLFTYFGDDYTTFFVSPNGWVGFNAATLVAEQETGIVNCSDYDGGGRPTTFIGGFGGDRAVLSDDGGSVSYWVTGEAPERVLVVQFENIRYAPDSSANHLDMQIVLSEGSNRIKIQYQDMTGETTGRVGIAGGAPDYPAVLYGESCPAPIADGLAIVYEPVTSDRATLSFGITTEPPVDDVVPFKNTAIVTDRFGNEAEIVATALMENPSDLTIEQRVSAERVDVGEELEYTIQVENTGPLPARSIIVSDTLPASVEFVEATGEGWFCEHRDGTVYCTRPTLDVEVAPELTITVAASRHGGVELVNDATVMSTAHDKNLDDNTTTTEARINDIPIGGLRVRNDSPTRIGETTTFTAAVQEGTNVSYTWDLGDGNTATGKSVEYVYEEPGSYTVFITATNDLGNRYATVRVEVVEPVGGLDIISDGPYPTGTPITLTADLEEGSSVEYTWSLGDDTGATGAEVRHIYDESGVYNVSVTASNVFGSETAETSMVVLEPIAGLTLSSDSPTKPDQTTTLSVTVDGGDNIGYTWDLGDGTTATDETNIEHTYPELDTYTVVVTATNELGSETATTSVVVTNAEPIRGLSATNDSPNPPGSVTTLEASVDEGNDVRYRWDLGDNTSGRGAEVNHSYSRAGTYTAVVTATNDISTVTTTTEVVIEEEDDTEEEE